MPTYRFIDYNELSSKPADIDMFAIYDIDADELKKFSYATLKAQFVKVNEPTDIEAILEFQSTVTKPNSILKFGAAGEFHVYSDGTDLFVKGTNAAGKLRFYTNSVEMLTLDPVADSIATYGNALNYDGTAGKGLIFAVTTNNARFTEQLNCKSLFVAENGIKMLSNNISYSGATDTGLEYDISNNAFFKQNLNVAGNTNVGILNASGQINANKSGSYSIEADGVCYFKGITRIGSWLNRSGSATKGMNMSAGDSATFSENAVFNKGIQTVGSSADIECWNTSKFVHGSNNGWTGTINLTTDNTILVSGGIIYGKT